MPRARPGDRPDDMHPLGATRLTCVEAWAGRAMLFELLRNLLDPTASPEEKEAHRRVGEDEDSYHEQLARGPAYSLNDVIVKLAYAVRWLGEGSLDGGHRRLAFQAVTTSLADTILLRAAALDQIEPCDDEGPL